MQSVTVTSRRVRTPVADVVEDAVFNSADSQQIRIEVEGNPAVLTDPWQLRQIVTNLIGNATKYGRAPISVNVATVDDTVVINVEDHGDGMPAEMVDEIFERCMDASPGNAADSRGTGFGLYIVARLADLNHGTVAYRPNVPTGAVFTVALPIVGAGLELPRDMSARRIPSRER